MANKEDNKKKKKTPYRHSKLATFSVISLLILVVGVVLAVVYLARYRGQSNFAWLMWTSLIVIAAGFLMTIICMIAFRIADKRDKQLQEEALNNVAADDSDDKEEPIEQPNPTTPSQQTLVVDGSNVTYIPSREAYDFIQMGQYQNIDDKFAEIAKMDKTQFVIYVARLFSRKGYQVKLTPVMDNYDIDMLVEKMGVIIAVGCIITKKERVLCKDDIVCIRNGRAHYGVNQAMALTNTYFDRSALEYAQAEHMSLVDRNVLAQDFMS